MEKETKETTKPTLVLSGKDGNVFSVMGNAIKVAKKAGWSSEKISSVMKEARSGDYDHVIQTMMQHFEVE